MKQHVQKIEINTFCQVVSIHINKFDYKVEIIIRNVWQINNNSTTCWFQRD